VIALWQVSSITALDGAVFSRWGCVLHPVHLPRWSETYFKGNTKNPVRIVAFNIAEGWCRDVTLDIADEIRRRYVEYAEVPASVLRFLEKATRH
jgi:hypothetical protein